VDDHAPELAYHYSEGGREFDKVAHYDLIAGETALKAYAWEEALPHAESARKAAEALNDSALAARALHALGLAQHGLGATATAVENLSNAFALYEQCGDFENAASVLLSPIFPHIELAGLYPRALEALDEDSLTHARLLSRFSNGVLRFEDPMQGLENLERALIVASRHGDASLEMWTLERMGIVVQALLGDVERGLRLLSEALEIANRTNDVIAQAECHRWVSILARRIGRSGQAWDSAEESLRLAEKAGSVPRICLAVAQLAELSADLGKFEQFGRYNAQIAELHQVAGDYRGMLARQTQVAYESGDRASGDAGLKRCLEPERESTNVWFGQSVPELIDSVLVIATRAAPEPHGDGALLEAMKCRLRSARTPHVYSPVIAGLATLALRIGNDIDCEEAYRIVLPLWGRLPVGFDTSFDRLLGELAAASGKHETAFTHFEEALDFCRTAGYLPELAYTCAGYAEALLNRPGGPDRVRATKLIDEGLRVTAQVGMPPMATRLAGLKKKVSGGRARARFPDGLSRRELDVLKLVAAGKTNQQIADELVLSRYTVVRHLTRIFQKTNASNRADAAAYALRKGLAK
jgi:DNA-binding CsgD family transcriptional regulator/tetratricopeptide (TPR) repeat protein